METRAQALEDQRDFYGRYVYKDMVFPFYMSEAFLADKIQALRVILEACGLGERLPHLDCMDVGMGRQALCLALMGARSVSHFDISVSQQRRFAAYLARNRPGLPINSQLLDISQEPLGTDRFDFILLEGVIHHTAHVGRSLANVLASLRRGGRIWLMFYRSGCFPWFVCAVARRLLAADRPGAFLAFAEQWCDQHGLTDYKAVMNMVDDLFVPHLQLFTPFSYAAFVEAMGCRVWGASNPGLWGSLDHAALPSTGVFILQKVADPPAELGGRPPELLDPARSVDQLDPGLYLEPGPLAAIQCLAKVEEALKAETRRQVVYHKAILLHQLASPANWGLPAGDAPDYDKLMNILLG